jgi:hypothetical protein
MSRFLHDNNPPQRLMSKCWPHVAFYKANLFLHNLICSFYVDNLNFRGRGRMVVGITSTNAISCEFESRSWWGVLDIALCDSLSVACGRSTTPVSAINKTDLHDITETLMKVGLNTITITSNLPPIDSFECHIYLHDVWFVFYWNTPTWC